MKLSRKFERYSVTPVKGVFSFEKKIRIATGYLFRGKGGNQFFDQYIFVPKFLCLLNYFQEAIRFKKCFSVTEFLEFIYYYLMNDIFVNEFSYRFCFQIFFAVFEWSFFLFFS